MTDLTERLIAMRDRLKSVDPDRLLDREYAALENDRDTLAEAANRIAELEAEREALLRRARGADAVGYRYREALEKIASYDQPLDFDDMACARAALNPEGEGNG